VKELAAELAVEQAVEPVALDVGKKAVGKKAVRLIYALCGVNL